MNTIFTRSLFFLFAFCLLNFSLQAQQWRWGAKGGSTDDEGGRYEYLKDMASDIDGNIYIVATVAYGGMNIGGVTKTGWGNEDIVVASFKCDGSLRWSKVIGTPGSDIAQAIKVDKNGGVYITGTMFTNSGIWDVHMDADATIPPSGSSKSFYLIKYDKDGNYQWCRTPQADTVSMYAYGLTGPFSMDVENNGNVHLFCQLSEGEYGGSGSFVANSVGNYILKYDASGNFIGGNNLDIKIEGSSIRFMKMQRSARSGNYFVAGTIEVIDHVTVGGNLLTGLSYLTCFNADGQLQWYKESTGDMSILSQFAMDNDDNIYVTGYAVENGSFAGINFTGSPSSWARPFVMALSSSGDPIWASQADEQSTVNVGSCVAVRNSGEIEIGGWFVGGFSWGNAPEHFSGAGSYQPFITRFAKNGKVLHIDTLVAPSDAAYPERMVADGRDNIFIGGYFKGNLRVNGQNLYSTGGEADWWVAKYGYDCNCADIPEPSFSFTRNGYDLSFDYTGSNNYTTLEWDFGDGTTATGATASHTYPANSYQTVCVKVTNDCGDNIYCENIPLWPTDVSSVSKEDGITIYPNPANDVLTIDGTEKGASIQLYDIMGRKVMQQIATGSKTAINLSMLSAGNYLVQLTSANGNCSTVKIIKQ